MKPEECSKTFAKLMHDVEYGGEKGSRYWQNWILIAGVPTFQKTILTIYRYNKILEMADRLPAEALEIIKGDIE